MKQTYSKYTCMHDVCSKFASCLLHRVNEVLLLHGCDVRVINRRETRFNVYA